MKNELKHLTQPSDIILVGMIVLGLVMLISIDEGALQLIGICISVLGAISLFIVINQRRNSVLDPNLLKLQDEKKKYNVTKKEGPNATIKIIENFGEQLSMDDELYGMDELDNKNEGFKIIGTETKKENTNTELLTSSDSPDEKPHIRTEKKANTVAVPQTFQDLENDNLAEGFRVVGKKKNKEETSTTTSVPTKSNISDSSDNHTVIASTKSEVKETSTTLQSEISTFSKTSSNNRSVPSSKKQSQKQSSKDLNWESLLDGENFPSNQPKKELVFFLQRILRAIKSTDEIHTACFFLYDSQKQLLKIEAKISDRPEDFITGNRLPIGTDIISSIAIAGKPTIISRIATDTVQELLPYYSTKVDVKSYIGIPIMFGDSVVGVLCADSLQENAFNELSATFFGHFTKLLSGLIQSYSEKFDLKQLAESYNAISNFRLLSSDIDVTESDISSSLAKTLNISFEPKSIGIVLYDSNAKVWTLKDYLSSDEKNYVGNEIDSTTLLSECINTGSPKELRSTQSVKLSSDSEIHFSDPTDVYIIPLKTKASVFGCFFITIKPSITFNVQALQMMEVLAEYAAIAVEKIYLSKIIRNNAFYNSVTGLLNQHAFIDRLESEKRRAEDFGYSSSLIFFKIDKYDAYIENDDESHAIADLISQVLSENVREYDFIGHFKDCYAVVTVGTELDNTRVWSERVKNIIATNTVESDKKELSVTVTSIISQFGKGEKRDTTEIMTKLYSLIQEPNLKSNSVTVYS